MFKLVLEKAEEPDIKLSISTGSLKKQESFRKTFQFSSVQLLSHIRLFVTPCVAAGQASLSITNSQSSLRLKSIESVMPSSHLILCRPLLLLPIPPSIKVFSNESTLRIRWPKYWSFSFSIIPSKETPGLISFRMDWLDLLAKSTCNVGDLGWENPPGEGKGYPLQYSGLENSVDCIVYRVAKSQT